MELPEIASVAKDLASALAVGLGLWFAWLGLKTWQEQLHGTTGYQLALRSLTAVLNLRREIQRARNPWMGVEEWADRTPGADESVREREIRNEAHAYFARLRPAQAATDALDVIEMEIRALWGKEADRQLQALRTVMREHVVAHDIYFRGMLDSGGRDRETLRTFHDRLYAPPENDTFGDRLNSAVEACEAFFRTKLK